MSEALKDWTIEEGNSNEWEGPSSEIHPVSLTRTICEDGKIVAFAVETSFSLLDRVCNEAEARLIKRATLMANAPQLFVALRTLMAWNAQNVQAPNCPAYDSAARLIEQIEQACSLNEKLEG